MFSSFEIEILWAGGAGRLPLPLRRVSPFGCSRFGESGESGDVPRETFSRDRTRPPQSTHIRDRRESRLVRATGGDAHRSRGSDRGVHGARAAACRSGLHTRLTTQVTPHKTLDSAAQESYTGGNSKDAVQPALSRRSSARVECIQCTPMSEAPAARKAVHSASACSRDRSSANRSASASKAGLAA